MTRSLLIVGLALLGAFTLSACGDTLCEDGATRTCKTACGSGTEICVNNAWANCNAPAVDTEVCDGLDNNCDGQTDETCDCVTGRTESCFESETGSATKGQCRAGTRTCTAGTWGACLGQELPDNSETCDGIDNTCDGVTDEGCACVHGKSESCFSGPAAARGKGKCKDGTHICSMGVWGNCLGEVLPDATEACDGIDNNCDGNVDEGCSCTNGNKQSCTSACGKGEAICVNGQWANCTAPQPQQEICDGIDNDCDGQVDEVCACVVGKTEACFSGPAGNRNKGICKDGVHTCTATGWGACTGEVTPEATDRCDDLLDNDCDGIVNDGCTCSPGATQNCGTDVGECVHGTQTCSNNQWQACVGATDPVDETCDYKDNNCDGKTDEGLPQDDGESNDNCTAAKAITIEDTATEATTLSYTIYPTGDVDYIAVTASDLSSLDCIINVGKPKCQYVDITITDPESAAAAAYQATVYGYQCGVDDTSNAVLNAASPYIGYSWEGTCGLNASATFWIKVEPIATSTAKFSCKPYTLTLQAYADDSGEGCTP